ncbi:hypothetical protein KIN20_017112 [Parelaphostrongylus tenuis]|uniref:Uncharacterized protein n=1 Tax=Parelaphostrongylus tenuis TaxID=148309 RepID=A0AAD5MHG9_PARTN|nr:hypothetical protein KIN20_017112 [Parelaphostrongylus tenuis]
MGATTTLPLEHVPPSTYSRPNHPPAEACRRPQRFTHRVLTGTSRQPQHRARRAVRSVEVMQFEVITQSVAN